MSGKAAGFLKAIPAVAWAILAALGLLLAAFLRGLFVGRKYATDQSADATGRARIKAMGKAVEAGDDAEAQRQAFDGIHPKEEKQ